MTQNPSATGADWQNLRLPHYERCVWSPEAPGEGIWIQVPGKISLGASAGRVPLFGTVRLSDMSLKELGIRDQHPLRAVVVGGIVANVNSPYVGNAVLQAPLFPAKPAPMITEYFAIDLVECAGLPKGPGVFFAFASVGPLLARPLKVEVIA
jgi:hypothetical protein